MKNTIKNLAVLTVVAFFTYSFVTVDTEKKEIKTDKSQVVWKGYKVTGSHEGTIAIQSGFLSFEADKLKGGEFVIDMSSINTTDLKGIGKNKLDKHLKSDDFFDVVTYPTAKLVFTNVEMTGKNAYTVTGDLTIKDKTNSIAFVVSIYGNKANVNLKIDRTKFGIEYKSTSFFNDLKNKAIYDEFDLVSDLEF